MIYYYLVKLHNTPRRLLISSSLRPLRNEEVNEIAGDFERGEPMLFTTFGVNLKLL